MSLDTVTCPRCLRFGHVLTIPLTLPRPGEPDVVVTATYKDRVPDERDAPGCPSEIEIISVVPPYELTEAETETVRELAAYADVEG